jgi:hypothetical protein
MERNLLREIKLLRWLVVLLFTITSALVVNVVHPLLPTQTFDTINAERLNIREPDGTLKLALSNSNKFKGRNGLKTITFAGLIFCNQEGEECGGLTYDGSKIEGGQSAEADLTLDQFHQDQNVVFEHHELRNSQITRIIDGVAVNARPDWKQVKEEFSIYDELERMKGSEEQKNAARLGYAQQGKVMTRRLFVGVRRGSDAKETYDECGIFIRNTWGRDAIKLYVDKDNKPHLQVFDPLGEKIVYEANFAPGQPQ